MEVAGAAEGVVKPLKEFGKNSLRLVKRCTKPDRKGACVPGDMMVMADGSLLHARRGLAVLGARQRGSEAGRATRACMPALQGMQGPGCRAHGATRLTPPALLLLLCGRVVASRGVRACCRLNRVQQDLLQDRPGFCAYGLHWLLREAHLHRTWCTRAASGWWLQPTAAIEHALGRWRALRRACCCCGGRGQPCTRHAAACHPLPC
jgi:hypothetical protein